MGVCRTNDAGRRLVCVERSFSVVAQPGNRGVVDSYSAAGLSHRVHPPFNASSMARPAAGILGAASFRCSGICPPVSSSYSYEAITVCRITQTDAGHGRRMDHVLRVAVQNLHRRHFSDDVGI